MEKIFVLSRNLIYKMQTEETFMHFLLKHQQKNNRTLNFVILMEAILSAAREIAHQYDLSAIRKNTGKSGSQNTHGEKTFALDEMAHKIVMEQLKGSGQVMEATSEENPKEIRLNDDGRYFLYFDPLDGSANIEHNLPVGFLFGIGKRNLEGDEDYHIRKGIEFIASGMFTLPQGIFTFALKNSGAWRFIREETGAYVRPEKIEFPKQKKSWILSFNTSYRNYYDKKITNWINNNENKYGFRYGGSLAIDFHRLLNTGGLFMYPAIVNHTDSSKNQPKGKLRLMYEANVVAMIAKEAGGMAINDRGEDIMEINPKDRHERTGIYVGSEELVEEIRKILIQ